MAPPAGGPEEEEEEDDYMNMTFGEEAARPAPAIETSLQRRQRLKREGEERGRIKSRAELEAEAAASREEALSRSMLEGARAKKSKGLAMMARMGYKPGEALGASASEEGNAAADAQVGRTEPIQIQIKEDRGGIGLDSERKRKVNDAAERLGKRARADEDEFRDRVRREREEARWERQVVAAMKVCEGMEEEDEGSGRGSEKKKPSDDEDGASADYGDEEEDGENKSKSKKEEKNKKKKSPFSTRPLKSIPVEWRGLVRRREEAERDRRIRYDLEQSSAAARTAAGQLLPTYAAELDGDEDDRTAVGRSSSSAPAHAPVEDLEEEDDELEAFDALDPGERLRRVVAYLRARFRYCFWCKSRYPDEDMDGCPGLTEEDHD